MFRLLSIAVLAATSSAAQNAAPPAGHEAMDHAPGGSGATDHAAMGHAMPGMDHGGHVMPAALGTHAMTREASGTAWQPDASPMDAVHWQAGDWSMMAHGFVSLVHDDQGGPRGATKTFSESMGALMASRPVGDGGRLGLRGMLSLDPLMGRRGYPLLLATGETADGVTGLVDRQHPHDLFMELAATYSQELGDGRAVSIYAAYPGEPALGPPTFMHRASGMDGVEAPIGHHWFDSTHITFGVVTAGYSTRTWKLEASAFKGREPDEARYGFDRPKLDSWSVRGFWNPTPNWSLQLSTGRLNSPEQLHPDEDEQRTTASVSYGRLLAGGGSIAATLAYSLKDLQPGPRLHAGLAELSWRIDGRNTVFTRAEVKQDDELFENEPASPLHERQLDVGKLSLGYARTIALADPVKLDLGGLVSAYAWGDRLDASYGKPGIKSFMLFARVKLAR